MSIQREFPSYDDMKGFADLLAKLPGFVDSSWHNDTCPSMHHEGTNTRIWVEYADPEKRENPGKRFVIERGDAGDTETILETDLGSDVIDWYHNRKIVVCKKRHLVDSDDDSLDRYANVGDKGKAEWDERTDQWSIVWQSNGAWGFYSEEDLAKLCVIDDGQLLTPNNCGCSPLACSIINETFLELDGFAAMREQMKGTSYTAEQFAGELARIVDRAIKDDGHVSFALEVLRIMSGAEWDSDTTQAIADAAHERGFKLLEEPENQRFSVVVKRTETYTATIVVDAVSAIEAQLTIQDKLDAGGWDDVFPDDDGNYDECFSVVNNVSPQKDSDQ